MSRVFNHLFFQLVLIFLALFYVYRIHGVITEYVRYNFLGIGSVNMCLRDLPAGQYAG